MKKVLVTGGCGFIGRHLIRALLKQGFSVTSIDNFYRWNVNDLNAVLSDSDTNLHTFIEGDIQNEKLIDELVSKSDIVIHLAGISQVITSIKYPKETFDFNVIGTRNIVDSCTKYQKKLIFSSSREVYGTTSAERVDESMPQKAENPYGSSKIIGEQIIKTAGVSAGLDYLIFRLANVYGPDDKGRIMPILISNALSDKPITIFGKDKVIDFIHIHDVITAFIEGLKREILGNHVVNIGSGVPVVLSDLLDTIMKATGSKSKVEMTENRAGEVDHFCANNTKAKEVLSWSPTISLQDGIDQLIRDYKSESRKNSQENLKIGFIGQGWIGKNYADEFEERGYEVIRYALEKEYVHNLEKIKECEMVFIAVPTPTTANGFDISIVESCLKLVQPGSTVVIKSTIIPGTTAKLQKMFPELYIFHSPEFLKEVTAKYDVAHPSRNIVGTPMNNEEYLKRANLILSVLPFSNYSKVIDAESAEYIKYISNGFLTMKVLFFNAMYDLIEKSGHDYYTIIEGVVADKRIGNSHSNILYPSGHNQGVAGRGAGGHCFIKDYQALLNFYFDNLGTTLGYKMLESAKEYNIHLLRSTNKDLDILRQTYEN